MGYAGVAIVCQIQGSIPLAYAWTYPAVSSLDSAQVCYGLAETPGTLFCCSLLQPSLCSPTAQSLWADILH